MTINTIMARIAMRYPAQQHVVYGNNLMKRKICAGGKLAMEETT
jgi:hypothetical protein